MSARTVVRTVGGLLAAAILFVLVVGAWPYLLLPRYRFDAPSPFSGPALLNPYADASGKWWKANFHAHSYAWHGLTNGHQPPAEVLSHYREMGYDIACLSNYESIGGGSRSDPDFIPDYEHGYNVRKVHQLAIGARRVTWIDFPFVQTLSEKQYMLDRLNLAGGIVTIAHPWLRNGYPRDQLRYLTHYTLMEVVRHGYAGTDRWDAALSAGHLSWALGDDDSHDISRPGDTGISWTMVEAPSTRREDVLAALRAGHTYAVLGKGAENDVLVRAVELHGDTLVVRTDPGATSFRFVGQDGAVRSVVQDSMEARYVVRASDTYVRAEVVTPGTHIYLNPVFRYDGRSPRQPGATLDRSRTWLARGLLIVVALLAFWGLWGIVHRRRRGRADASLGGGMSSR